MEYYAHQPVLEICQKFPKPAHWTIARDHDLYINNQWVYKPLRPMSKLEGKRRRLILAPRSHMKTFLQTQGGTIQWLINYPDIAIAIFQSNEDKVKQIIQAIKQIFQFNERFRTLFPEFCPQKRIDDWGTVKSFTVEARSKEAMTNREPSVLGVTLGSGTAGMHFHVMKFTDIVEPDNVRTRERVAAVINDFNLSQALLVTPQHWIDVEGTRYVFGDLYGEIIKQWWDDKGAGREPQYDIAVTSAYRRVGKDGKPCKFTPDELDNPFLLDENGIKVPWWAEDNEGNPRFPVETLERMEREDPYNFSAQYMNNPIGGTDGKVTFEVHESKAPPRVISRADYQKNIRIVYRDITIDTAWTTGNRSDYTAIVVGAFDRGGRCYIEEILHGKFQQEDLVKNIIQMYLKYKPDKVKWEKVPFNEGLELALRRDLEIQKIAMPLVWLKRDNQMSKIDRISSFLPLHYSSGSLIFLQDLVPGNEVENLRVWRQLKTELKEFPLSTHDDILDAITDLFQEKDTFGRLTDRPLPVDEARIAAAQQRIYLGISTLEEEDDLLEFYPAAQQSSVYARSGGL